MSNPTLPAAPSCSAADAAAEGACAPPLSLESFDLRLRDGRAVHLRAVSPADEEELLQAFERMSADARYMRFMHVVHTPNLQRLRALLGSFPEAGIGIVATVAAADGIDIAGSAIAVFSGDRSSCEFAVSVAATFGGAGLATALMTTLIDEARRRGLQQMEGCVLAANQPMLRLARRLGFGITSEPGEASVRICRLQLAGPAPAQTTIGTKVL